VKKILKDMKDEVIKERTSFVSLDGLLSSQEMEDNEIE
jgi:hypothetical protein